jgi:hypothetical protein
MTARDKKFKEKAESLGYKVREYSGRNMFGRVCLGATVDNPNDFIAEMGMKGLKVDQMGLSYIVYTG